MIDTLLKASLAKPWRVMFLTLLLGLFALWQATKLPVDAVPDITNVQVQINTVSDGFSPLETEQRITYAIETAMAGLPQLAYTRSLSRFGLSQVTVIFKEGTDIYWARQLVSERLQLARAELPVGIEPQMGPIVSGLGEIFSYSVTALPNAQKPDGSFYNAEDLRTLQDWVIKPQLLKVVGVTEINTIGGFVREYQVIPDPFKLLAMKLTFEQLAKVLERNNNNVGAGFIEQNGEQWLIRSVGQLGDIQDIENLVIASKDSALIRIKDVADVIIAKQLRTGAATQNGQEVVLGTVMMLLGENSRTVAIDVAKQLTAINSRLPTGVLAQVNYNRTTLVDKTIATVRTNLFEGALLVVIVLLLFLGNIRAAIITALVIPLSMLFALTGMAANNMSGNLMSLGAIDFGLIVDGSVIVVENCLRQLGIAQQQRGRLLDLGERLAIVFAATKAVMTPALFGVGIIMLVYVPIFALDGVEGKMFQPMAFTVIAALFGALVLAMTFVPAAIALFVKGPISEHENKLMVLLRSMYRPLLSTALRLPLVVMILALVVLISAFWQAKQMGSEFLPKLDEGDVAMHAMRIVGTSLSQSVAMQQLIEQEIITLPQVLRVFSKIGTPEVATDPMPPNVADTFIILKPRAQWPDPTLTREQLVNQIREKVTPLPGNNYEFTQPIEMRFNELIAGVRSDIAVRVYGDDLETLQQVGKQLTKVLESVAGTKDVAMEQAAGLPVISITPKAEHLALAGMDVATMQQVLQNAVGGQQVGVIFEGDKRFNLVVRLPENQRSNIEALGRIPIALAQEGHAELQFLPLAEVASLTEQIGPNQINRESGKRNVVITANVSGRDLGSVISDIQQKMAAVSLPPGYWLDYGGTFKQLQSATARLTLVVPLTLLLILLMLYSALNNWRDTLVVFSGVPFALCGGVFALLLRDMPISISAAVGFIALCGIAVLNGIVMVSFIRQLQYQGQSLDEAIMSGAMSRLRPVLMTALVASLGFIPMAFNIGTGAEIQRPLATVVIGGIVSSTLLTLLVLPAIYRLAERLRIK
ncbi:efflux RND transporter permease subunit [Pseudoalteromonas tunicata]|uniref:Cobalt-zinc-cadmium resistance protein czcA (Cation efflux system protein czcA) n=1 Tax=Pseudoalteromonas tunicata D2 TaxID=87626 RepID=A4C6K8_9GAMM|nr:CusA/CzcA family heavy metal efflux RND transporter [Pseudoalteromonas tunicata]ATC95586.1 cobalt-zinc-cadmium resistance protein CzcA [Pseudoalteromonas tunicata]AXT31156.1 CusA/CzcA family heavy metal efflux RND transporter [Pseudoalteromonas tunicata]EAR29612.1 Cobalt-zinc-cadmium resistance protein czcA (Cation efflux system protein czcA) [Pseudoalteromonas tunicata D2]